MIMFTGGGIWDLERILDRAVDREFEREGRERSGDLELDRSRGFDAE
jgi:hypothetical protein